VVVVVVDQLKVVVVVVLVDTELLWQQYHRVHRILLP
jgi:hypothetical protein